MRKLMGIVLVVVGSVALLSDAAAQPPAPRGGKDTGKNEPKDFSKSSIVIRMMAFDKRKDGRLTKDEITDERLHRLFDLADANKDGVVTQEELIALAAKLEAEVGAEDERGGPGPGGPGPGGPGGRGPGGPGGPPQPGQILPPRLQEALKLTADQKKQLDELQQEVDRKLGKILTDEQKKQLKEMRDRGPGGPGRPGPGGPPER